MRGERGECDALKVQGVCVLVIDSADKMMV